MSNETKNQKPRMAAYKTDLFAEIVDLESSLKKLRIQNKVSMMLNALLFFLVLLTSIPQSHADVFKCKLANGNTIYQHAPCLDAVNVIEVPIKKNDPIKEAEAKKNLAIWQANYEAKEDAEAKKLKAQEEAEINRQTANSLQQTANAQNEQAYQLKREADARYEGNRISAFANGIYNRSTPNNNTTLLDNH